MFFYKSKSFQIKNGFTMVDLMTTLLIVGILFGIAAVSYGKYTNKARLAEATSDISAISKNEATYFINHHEFYFLNPNPGYFQYLNGTISGNEGTWDVVGNPIAPGTKVIFSYGGYPGQTDAGNVEVVYNSTSGSSNMMFSTASSIGGFKPDHTGCSNQIPISNYISVAGKPQYNWIMIHASRDFDISEPYCTTVFKSMDTDSRGNVRGGAPILTDHEGY